MRACIVIKKVWVPTVGQHSVICPGNWVPQPAVPALFHKFVTETSDGEMSAMAIVEFEDGTVDTIPLSWLVLEKYKEAEMTTLESVQMASFFSEDFEAHIKHIMEVGLHQFTMMCQNVANKR